MEPTWVSKENFDSKYQIMLGMSNQFLATHLIGPKAPAASPPNPADKKHGIGFEERYL